MHDGVGAGQPDAVDEAALGIPADLAGGGRVAHEAQHFEAARREKGAQSAPDEARGAAHRHAQRPAGAHRRVPLEVGRQLRVAKLEHALQARANGRAGDRASERAERQLVLDVVFDGAAERRRREAVRVHPAMERPRLLLVDELATGDEVAMARRPAQRQRTERQADDGAAAVDAALTLEDARRLPGRGQPLERARPRVPGEHVVDGVRHLRPRDQTAHAPSSEPDGWLMAAM